MAPLGGRSLGNRCAILRAVRRRIAFIDYFATHYRQRLYEELAQRMEVDFYFFADQRERYWNRRIPLVTEGGFRRVELRRYRIAGQAVMPRLPLELSPRRYDAVVKSLNGKLMLPAVYLASRARGVPFVLWTGMWHHPRTRVHTLSRPLTEHIYQGAEAIVAYGEHVKRFLAETAAIDPGKVFVAGQAVRAEPFEAVVPSCHGLAEVLFVGQFEERKGLVHLVDAFASQPDLQAKLRLVGNGSLEPLMTLRAAQDPRVELVGYVPQERLPAELARSRCLVLPSVTTDLDREPWGLVINEAMHAGVPVVTTDGVGAAAGGLVEDGRNGFVVPEGDAAALARAVRSLVSDPALARRLGDRAREDVRRFNYMAMADAFEAAVEHAIAARG
jgi:glycosyltransferase involved in cell wall biosynthesis